MANAVKIEIQLPYVLVKPQNRQLCTGRFTVRYCNTAAQKLRVPVQCADDDRIREHFKDTKHSLLYRFARICAGMRNRARTKSRLIREEKIPRETPFFILTNILPTIPPVTADGLKAPPMIAPNADGRAPCMNHNNAKSKNHIEKRHKRHQLLRYSSDSFDSAKQNHAYQNRDHNTDKNRFEVGT